MDLTRLGVGLRSEGRLAQFSGATGWLNSPPLTPDDLRGKVVLADFWTYTCINWLRTLGYVRAWAERYAEQGLVVVGVHTPEFPFERDVDNVRRAAQEMRVEYPVALDSEYAVWHAFANQYWPAVYIADAEGRIRHHQFGEGGYEECERSSSVAARGGREGPRRPRLVGGDGLEAQADWAKLETPETYLGYELAQTSRPPAAPSSTSLAPTPRRIGWRSTNGRSPGSGRSSGARACSTEPAGGSRFASTRATSTSSWARPRAARPCRSACWSTAGLPATATGSTSMRRARDVSEPRLYQLVRQPDRSPTARSRSSSPPPASRPTCSPSASGLGARLARSRMQRSVADRQRRVLVPIRGCSGRGTSRERACTCPPVGRRGGAQS